MVERCWLNVVCLLVAAGSVAGAAQPTPILKNVFPAGARVGTSSSVTVSGDGLKGLSAVRCSHSGIVFRKGKGNSFTVTVSADTTPGLYDIQAICASGLSSLRAFFVTRREHVLDIEPNESAQRAQQVPMDAVISGRIENGGDLDQFRFNAKRGQRVVIECWAKRIDSRLRAVLELFDADGRRLASNRGYFGVDPLVDFRVPADGTYVVKLYDLIYSGSAEHYYRLDIDTGPRVAFSVPSVIQRGKAARVTLYGWNLNQRVGQVSQLAARGGDPGHLANLPHEQFDRIEVDIPATRAPGSWPLPVRLQPAQAVIEGFAYDLPGSHAPVMIGVTDVPVVLDGDGNHSAKSAREICYPCEVSGQLIAGDERDWFALEAKRGEVLYMEGFGQRINSPADLAVSVLDSRGQREFVNFGDEVTNIGGRELPTSHLDPAGRWVVPADGRYLIMIRNLIGGLHADPRRTYRLSVRREEPELHLAAVPRLSPRGLNVRRGGRAVLDILAFRRRGLDGPIRVTATDLPSGIECPDVWLGPGVNRAAVVVSADRNAPPFIGQLKLEGFSAELAGRRKVRGGTVVRTGLPNGWGRLTSEVPFAVAGDAALRITANGHETRDHHLYGELKVRHAPGGILDVAVHVQRRDAQHSAPVRLIGVGLPDLIHNQTATIPAGQDKGYLSFYLPPTLPVGRYTLAVRAETTVPLPDEKTETVSVYSNPVTFDVHPPGFRVEIDPYTPRRIKRGAVVQVKYTARRINGFISKIHTELASPGKVTDVGGLRGRGVTFVGQTESGTIQVIASEGAPLGQLPFLRLYAVGVLEDEPVFHGSRFLNLEIVP